MIKKISVAELIPGMYIHDLNCGWMDHPFLTNSFAVEDEEKVAKIRAHGIREVYIDTEQGLDVTHAPTREEVQAELQQRMVAIATRQPEMPRQAALAEEAPRARKLHTEANRIVRHLLSDIRLGAQIELDKVEPLVETMVDSIFANQNALLPLAGLKQHDSYTFEHSVSVCALMVAFSRGLELPRETIREIAQGALLHDVGKARVPEAILNKPARLTEAEFAQMKNHVVQSIILLQHTPGISPTALQVAGQHHERYDGSGYPNGLQGDGISLYGQMAAIVDVYDAISSDRVYHKGMPPSEALKKLLEWSSHHFEPRLVHNFIRAIGIYPTGSLVRLESGRLAVVREQNEHDLLHPVVQVIYHGGQHHYLPPETIDLARSQDRVVGHEDFSKWNIDPRPWLSP
ncbi:HD-GYP domain-containing protein [Azovibrio restrictus]|uniref:HD-GYP domain-containing protein n=1 Tax=Azovibrio restrictus TaxID=146938 RepID=UPI0026EF0FAA|nr:HD-GYP domain-containing protein [Azovibrio restrictus]MDD3482535.1 HD-GYP domain-containing protein [Azovibrio restrictus]